MVAARGQPEGTEVEARESMNNGAAVGRGGDDTTCAAGTVLDDEVETHHRLAGDEGVAAGELGDPDWPRGWRVMRRPLGRHCWSRRWME